MSASASSLHAPTEGGISSPPSRRAASPTFRAGATSPQPSHRSSSRSWVSLTRSPSYAASRRSYDPTTALAAKREAAFDLSSAHVQLQKPWDSHSRGNAVPWRTYEEVYSGRRNGPLRLDLQPNPQWVAKAPGTGLSTFERPVLRPQRWALSSHAKTPPPVWDNGFVHLHSVDRNPVVQGTRKGLDNRAGVGYQGSFNKAGQYKVPPPT